MTRDARWFGAIRECMAKAESQGFRPQQLQLHPKDAAKLLGFRDKDAFVQAVRLGRVSGASIIEDVDWGISVLLRRSTT